MTTDETVKKLAAWGCDITGVRERLCGDDELWIHCIKLFCDDACFTAFEEGLRGGDIKRAFENAHSLKGVIANLGLTPMFPAASAVVEPLRSGVTDNVERSYQRLCQLRDQLRSLVE